MDKNFPIYFFDVERRLIVVVRGASTHPCVGVASEGVHQGTIALYGAWRVSYIRGHSNTLPFSPLRFAAWAGSLFKSAFGLLLAFELFLHVNQNIFEPTDRALAKSHRRGELSRGYLLSELGFSVRNVRVYVVPTADNFPQASFCHFCLLPRL